MCDQGCTKVLTIQVENGESLFSVMQNEAFPNSLLSSSMTNQEVVQAHKRQGVEEVKAQVQFLLCREIIQAMQSNIKPDGHDDVDHPRPS